MFINPAETMKPAPLRHNPFKAIVVPRPIGWITTISRDGVVNLAPFSFFNAVSDDPPCVIYCPNGRKPDGSLKDSLINAQETGEFVFNLCTWDLREAMNRTSAHEPASVDEMVAAGLAPAPCVAVRPPRVAATPAALECRYLQTVELPRSARDIPVHVVIGEVVGLHLDESVIVDGLVDVARLMPVARLGYRDFTVVTERFEMLRPDD